MSYKKRELRVLSGGFNDLAKAVIRQWRTDGSPRSSEDGIRSWGKVLQQHHKNIGGAVRQGTLIQ